MSGWVSGRAGRSVAAALAVLLFGIVAIAVRGQPAGLIATKDQPVVTLAGTNYLDASAFLARYGLTGEWVEKDRRMRFESAWTKLELELDKREAAFNGIRLFLGDAVLARERAIHLSRLDAEWLLAPLLRPATFAGQARPVRTIVIDAGHGGQDTGTRNPRLKLDEKGFALDVAQRLAALLTKEGYRVVMTRDDDTFVPLAERAEIAKRAGADLFVSIHFNAVASAPAVRGTETYIVTPQFQRSTDSTGPSDSDKQRQPGNSHDPWNTVLGYQVHRQLLAKLGTFDRGLKRARFAVLRLAECPAVLVEAGYLSNDAEAEKIATPAYRTAIAEAVADGIASYAAIVVEARRP